MPINMNQIIIFFNIYHSITKNKLKSYTFFFIFNTELKMKQIPFFILIFFTLFVTTIGSLLFIYTSVKQNYLSYQDNLLNTTISQINQTIIEKSTQYLMPATILVETSSQFVKNNVININNKTQVEHYLQSQLKMIRI